MTDKMNRKAAFSAYNIFYLDANIKGRMGVARE